MLDDYPAKSLDIQARLKMLGLMPSHLMLMGAFITVYGLFENSLERALWALRGERIKDVRPFTETMPTETRFKLLGTGSVKLSVKCNAILKIAAHAAQDLNEYRNSLVHGYIVPYGAGSVPSFMKNPHWYDANGRKKAVGDAYILEPFQDLVLIAAWSLFALVRKLETVFTDPNAQSAIEAMKDDVDRAKSYAHETRHLRSLMNQEKY